MKADEIEALFKDLQPDFDIDMPGAGHEQRFLEKLQSNKIGAVNRKRKRTLYKPFMVVAASIVLCFGLFIFLQIRPEVNDLASVSPELSQTQDFFTAAITSELNKVKNQRNPENKILVSDALNQTQLLEKNYERLKNDLKESGNDKRVIYAMISNFQSRIDILENVLKTIKDLNEFKQSEHHQMTF